jgi:hypothetical protein
LEISAGVTSTHLMGNIESYGESVHSKELNLLVVESFFIAENRKMQKGEAPTLYPTSLSLRTCCQLPSDIFNASTYSGVQNDCRCRAFLYIETVRLTAWYLPRAQNRPSF